MGATTKKATQDEIEAVETAAVENNDDLILVNIPLTREHQEDVAICINGYWTIIQRGVDVYITPAVNEVLQNKLRMQALALQRSLELQKKAEEF